MIHLAITWKYSAVINGLNACSCANFKSWLTLTKRILDFSASLLKFKIYFKNINNFLCLMLLINLIWSAVVSLGDLELVITSVFSLINFVNIFKVNVIVVHSDLSPKHHLVNSLIPSILRQKNKKILTYFQK